MTTAASATDTISKLSNYLPTGTFLTFQAVAPLFTNNGVCGHPEKIVTSLLVFIMGVGNVILAYTDSIAVSGKSYYGLVTVKGLYNPNFAALASSTTLIQGSYYVAQRFMPTIFDFLHGIISAIVFLTLVLLTPPVQPCFFSNSIPETIVKSVPILVALVAGSYFALAPAPRKSLGYAADTTNTSVDDTDSDVETSNTAALTAANNNTTTTPDAAADAEVQSSAELAAKDSTVSPTASNV